MMSHNDNLFVSTIGSPHLRLARDESRGDYDFCIVLGFWTDSVLKFLTIRFGGAVSLTCNFLRLLVEDDGYYYV